MKAALRRLRASTRNLSLVLGPVSNTVRMSVIFMVCGISHPSQLEYRECRIGGIPGNHL
jgi:hypothetical protein